MRRSQFMLSRRSVMILGSAAVLVPVAGAAHANEPKPYDATAFAAAQASRQPILVEIHAVWCGTCKIQKAIIGDLLKSQDFAKLAIFRVDFDDQKDVVTSFGADMQSTLIVYKGKTELGRSVGQTNGKTIEDLLRLVV